MRPLFFLFLIFYISFASAQNINQETDPPGTIKLNENLFIDKAPVTNQMFLEYLKMKDYLRSQNYNSWKNYYTDKNDTVRESISLGLYPSLLKELEGDKSLLSNRGYFNDYQYSGSPVLRITKAQAEDFCQWRTEMVEYAWTFFPQYAHQKGNADKIQYRLPSAEELQQAQDYFSNKNKLVSISKKNPLKYKSAEVEGEFLRYNISEFTSSNFLFGENWKKVNPTEFPNDFTGFRCICEVRE